MEKFKQHFYWLPVAITLASAVVKLLAVTSESSELPVPGLADKLLSIALLELTVVTLYLIPKTRRIGFLLVCSYFGGAIATSYVMELSSPIVPALVLALYWLAEYFSKNLAVQMRS